MQETRDGARQRGHVDAGTGAGEPVRARKAAGRSEAKSCAEGRPQYSHVGRVARRGQQQQRSGRRAPRAPARARAPRALHGRVQRGQHLVRVCVHCGPQVG